jgi:hypothetical protein
MAQFDLSHRFSHEGRPSLLICDSKSIEMNELKKFIDNTINSTCELLNLSKTRTESLLNSYSWDVPHLTKDYLNNVETTLRNANLSVDLIPQPAYDEGPWLSSVVDESCSSSINTINSFTKNSVGLNNVNIDKDVQSNDILGIDEVIMNIDKDDTINEDINEIDNNSSPKSIDNYKEIDTLEKDIVISSVNVFSLKSTLPDSNAFVSNILFIFYNLYIFQLLSNNLHL